MPFPAVNIDAFPVSLIARLGIEAYSHADTFLAYFINHMICSHQIGGVVLIGFIHNPECRAFDVF